MTTEELKAAFAGMIDYLHTEEVEGNTQETYKDAEVEAFFRVFVAGVAYGEGLANDNTI